VSTNVIVRVPTAKFPGADVSPGGTAAVVTAAGGAVVRAEEEWEPGEWEAAEQPAMAPINTTNARTRTA
jgi:hypothetical protein